MVLSYLLLLFFHGAVFLSSWPFTTLAFACLSDLSKLQHMKWNIHMGWNTTVLCRWFAVRFCFFSAKVCSRRGRTASASLSHCYIFEILLFELSKVPYLLRKIPVSGLHMRGSLFGFPSLLWLLPFDCHLQCLSCSQFLFHCAPSLPIIFLRQSFPPVVG